MKHTSNRLFEVCTSIPPIKPQNLLPVLIMLGLWVILRSQAVAEDAAFVVSVVTAQAYLVWRNLPMAAANLNKVGGQKSRMLLTLVGVTFAVALLQLWLSSPLFTQRVLTVLCVFFLVIMVLGILHERDVMDRLSPAMPLEAGYTPPVSLLRVNAMMAALIIAMNEWLIFYESPAVWITVMPVFMLVLHGVYWTAVLMTLPANKGEPA
ncbi:MAG: hypothetical protein P1U83_10335 [Roseovarius sp.]|nr:hypothetical protein [Roseovarius sp.]